MSRNILNIHLDLETDALYVKLRNLTVHTTSQEGRFVVDYSRSEKVVGIKVLHLKKHLQKHGKVSIPARYLEDQPVSLTVSKRKRLRAAVLATSGILGDLEAERMLEGISRSRGGTFTAPKDPD